MVYRQGAVVLAPDPFKPGMRPFAVLSNDNRPFFGDSYTVAVMSTTERGAAIEVVPGEDIEEGRLNKRSYINVWALHIMSHDDINRRVAHLTPDLTQRACRQAQEYLAYEE